MFYKNFHPIHQFGRIYFYGWYVLNHHSGVVKSFQSNLHLHLWNGKVNGICINHWNASRMDLHRWFYRLFHLFPPVSWDGFFPPNKTSFYHSLQGFNRNKQIRISMFIHLRVPEIPFRFLFNTLQVLFPNTFMSISHYE